MKERTASTVKTTQMRVITRIILGAASEKLTVPLMSPGTRRPSPASAPRREKVTAMCMPSLLFFVAMKAPMSMRPPTKAGIRAVTDGLEAPSISQAKYPKRPVAMRRAEQKKATFFMDRSIWICLGQM